MIQGPKAGDDGGNPMPLHMETLSLGITVHRQDKQHRHQLLSDPKETVTKANSVARISCRLPLRN